MRFYYWILLIIVLFNAILIFSSTGGPVKSYIFKNHDPILLILILFALSVLIIIFAFIFASKGKY